MGIVTAEQLTAVGRVKVVTAQVDVEGGHVVVRGLTRAEAHDVQVNAGGDEQEREIRICAAGMVKPELTVEQVRAWAASGPAGEMQDVSVRIAELSRLMPETAKEATKSVPRRG